MSQPWPNAPQQPQQPHQPPQAPYGAPAPGGFPAPMAPPAARRGNAGLAVALGVVTTLVAAGVYGAVLKAVDGASIGYAALAVGALIGAVLGKVGGRSAALPVVGAVLGLAGLYLGQVFGVALITADILHISVLETASSQFGLVHAAWKAYLGPIDVVFYLLAGAGGFQVTKKLGG
ncbi:MULTISPECIES: hypothetical protein [Streptomyces]|uniref:Uncharacterized protein n=2 Tax=Streptomyces rimosus subsp. rimosus TaxID=132474 RepID=L8EJQ0_STRR1|nr:MULTISPECIES: hypothetical protein [Streptomyces]KOG68375.1 hypothetical protein ADK78_37080 [Kitasatospora aureofaciens]MYT40883.1 hypothetical protein [Streptomyces sp. SID5471]KEF02494.1 hypothetical protein DF17_33420 [Streptomyces rimosus]KOT27437.1 hypothetical protein ADK84_38525 [Streptomyces sp. NRRL WC-3701]KOT27763.1 hypothetical protein ADK42_35635 [Streptomyces rimosus subsp. rimosus]